MYLNFLSIISIMFTIASARNDLRQITYFSATHWLTHSDANINEKNLNELLHFSREYNKEKNITGVLLYRDSTFFQIIEGPGENIELLMTKIMKDRRHYLVTIIENKKIEKRQFSDWNLLFSIPDYDLPKVPYLDLKLDFD